MANSWSEGGHWSAPMRKKEGKRERWRKEWENSLVWLVSHVFLSTLSSPGVTKQETLLKMQTQWGRINPEKMKASKNKVSFRDWELSFPPPSLSFFLFHGYMLGEGRRGDVPPARLSPDGSGSALSTGCQANRWQCLSITFPPPMGWTRTLGSWKGCKLVFEKKEETPLVILLTRCFKIFNSIMCLAGQICINGCRMYSLYDTTAQVSYEMKYICSCYLDLYSTNNSP